MQAGNFKILYFEDFRECFKVYELIVVSTDIKWEFPFQINDGYAILYKSKLDEILDIENYEIRWVINNPFTQIK